MAAKNGTPTVDGEFTPYTPLPQEHLDELQKKLKAPLIHPSIEQLAKQARSGNFWMIYTNGMQTTVKVHQQTTRELATIAGITVWGCYNMTGSSGGTENDFWADLRQSISDQTLRVGRTISDSRKRGLGSKDRAAALKLGYKTLAGNAAAQQLFLRLMAGVLANRPIILVCHSQGNLIAANALWVTLHIHGHVGNVHVFGLASPNASWPPNNANGLRFKLYRHLGDPVTLISVPWLGQAAKDKSTDRGSALDYSLDYHDVTKYYFMRRDFQRDLHTTMRSLR